MGSGNFFCPTQVGKEPRPLCSGDRPLRRLRACILVPLPPLSLFPQKGLSPRINGRRCLSQNSEIGVRKRVNRISNDLCHGVADCRHLALEANTPEPLPTGRVAATHFLPPVPSRSAPEYMGLRPSANNLATTPRPPIFCRRPCHK